MNLRFGLLITIGCWISPLSAQTLAPAGQPRPAGASVLWKDEGYELLLEPAARRGPQPLGYAVLRVGSSSPLLALLPSPTFLAPLPRSLDTQVALVPIYKLQELDRLAPLAHEETGMCGNLEFIPWNYRLAAQKDFAPAHYTASAYFPELLSILDQVQLAQIDSHLDQMTQLSSRFHAHPEGVRASETLLALWQRQLRSVDRWQITEYRHTSTQQRSVIARLPGLGAPEETVILGAHLDSIAVNNGGNLTGPAPGADDNASGLSILTEILRIVEEQGLRFHRSIELQAYAAEEIGLVGSREIATAYRSQNRPILGMLQFDMAYYSQPAQRGRIHFLEDYTSRDLRRQAVDWVLRYLGPVYDRGRMPRGSASDHKAWWEQGYPTLFPFQDPEAYNPFIHTTQDTRSAFDDGLLIQRMVKLGLLFVTYQAGATAFAESYASQASRLLPINSPRDLYFATSPAASGQVYLAISAPIATQFLEFCPIDEATDLSCQAERQTLDQAEITGARKLFYSDRGLALAKGQRWRIMAYDAGDQLLAWRQIEFE